MFSSRLDWHLTPNRLATALDEKRRAGVDVLDLTESNPTRAGFEYPSGIAAALGDQRSLRYEPSASGSTAAREAIVGYYSAQGVAVDPARIILAGSTSESYAWLFKLLADPGDEVLTPRPSYPLFEYLAALESVRAIQYPLAYHGRWSIDIDALRSLITPRTRAIVVVSPNNPTGSYLKRDELDALALLGIPIIADEVFSDYPFGKDASRITSLTNETVPSFSLNGLSKTCGLPQMKLGWIVLNGPAWEPVHSRLELIADTYLPVATPVQNALPRLLELGVGVRQQIQTRIERNRASLKSMVSATPQCELLNVEGGWYATVRVPRTRSEEEWCLELLGRDEVLVQPGFFYDFESEAYLVLSLLTEESVFDNGVDRLLRRIDVEARS